MSTKERKDRIEKIWRVPRKEPLKKFSILTTPALSYENKEDWYTERKKEIVEKQLIENKIF